MARPTKKVQQAHDALRKLGIRPEKLHKERYTVNAPYREGQTHGGARVKHENWWISCDYASLYEDNYILALAYLVAVLRYGLKQGIYQRENVTIVDASSTNNMLRASDL